MRIRDPDLEPIHLLLGSGI